MSFNDNLRFEVYARHRNRTIDKDTIIDLLCLVEHASNRASLFTEAGLTDNLKFEQVIYEYILDSLGIPEAFEYRAPYHSLFYFDFLVNRRWPNAEAFLTEVFSEFRNNVTRLQSK